MLKALKSTRGFSLIELLVVIVIMGILATASASMYGTSRAKARDGVRTSTAVQMQSGLLTYAVENENFAGMTTVDVKHILEADFNNNIPDDAISDDDLNYNWIFFASTSDSDAAVCHWSEANEDFTCPTNRTLEDYLKDPLNADFAPWQDADPDTGTITFFQGGVIDELPAIPVPVGADDWHYIGFRIDGHENAAADPVSAIDQA